MPLNGKIALITGGAHRVGKAIALRLAEEGCDIAMHYHGAAQAAQQTVAEIQALDARAHAIQADLRSIEAIHKLFDEIKEQFHRLDFLINSAAIMQRKPIQEITPDDWAATMNLNLRAPFFCMQKAANLMGSEGGVVINISDIAGLEPWVDFPVHSISKTGVEMLTKLGARAYGPQIRVNAVAPGPVLKPEKMSDERWVEIGSELPWATTGEAKDVAEAVLFLIRNEYISGETLVVDGGNQIG